LIVLPSSPTYRSDATSEASTLTEEPVYLRWSSSSRRERLSRHSTYTTVIDQTFLPLLSLRLRYTGSAHLHPSPSSLRPQSIVDASLSQPCSYGGLPLEAALPLVPEVTLSENYKILNPVKKLRYPSKQTEELGYSENGGPIQLDVLLPRPFIDASDWDSFEDVIFKISTGQEGRAKEVDVTGSTLDDIPAVKRNDRKIVVGKRFDSPPQWITISEVLGSLIAGLLPPPLAPHLPSQQLVSSGLYQAYVNHMSALSLNEHVYLLFAPPILSNAQPEGARPAGRWWTDRAELERVIRMYGEFASSHMDPDESG
jgi:hypothetical protein